MSNLPRIPWNKGSKLGKKHTEVCSISGCMRNFTAKGLCKSHYAQMRRGVPYTELGSRRRKGEGTKYDGYIRLYLPDHPCANKFGRVLEHRKVMCDILGRPLLDFENVHHINGIRDDNRPSNLELWITKQPAGQRPQDLVQFANEILALYGQKECS